MRTGLAQHYYDLPQAFGYGNSAVSSAKISKADYGGNSFVAVTDVERVPQAQVSGYNTSEGQTITASWKNVVNALENRPTKTCLVCYHDAVLELQSASAQVHT